MSDFEDQNLPPELGDVAKRLRDGRHEASPIELDQAKQRVLARASRKSPRRRRMRWLPAPTLLTAAVLALSVGGGSAAAFNIPFFNIPIFHHTVHHTPTTRTPPASPGTPTLNLGGGSTSTPSASSAQYNPLATFLEALFRFILSLFSGFGGFGF